VTIVWGTRQLTDFPACTLPLPATPPDQAAQQFAIGDIQLRPHDLLGKEIGVRAISPTVSALPAVLGPASARVCHCMLLGESAPPKASGFNYVALVWAAGTSNLQVVPSRSHPALVTRRCALRQPMQTEQGVKPRSSASSLVILIALYRK
jgi:hypothetical protein